LVREHHPPNQRLNNITRFRGAVRIEFSQHATYRRRVMGLIAPQKPLAMLVFTQYRVVWTADKRIRPAGLVGDCWPLRLFVPQGALM